MYLKLMIDGATSKPFSALTLPVKPYTTSYKDQVIQLSREKFGRERNKVEKAIFSRYNISPANEEPTTLFS
jgi:hypothetical protein